jgi:hypothetical protein
MDRHRQPGRDAVLLLGAAIAAALCGCRTGYWRARGQDLADVVTATTGPGLGAKVRLGPAHLTPLLVYTDTTGLRGGECFYLPGLGLDEVHPPQDVGALWWASSIWVLPNHRELAERAKAHLATPLSLPPDAELFDLMTDTPPFVSMPRLEWKGEKLALDRYPVAYHSDLELTLALGWGVRLGLNPGEALDFVLGWCLVDLYRDDLDPDAATWQPSWFGVPLTQPRPAP